MWTCAATAATVEVTGRVLVAWANTPRGHFGFVGASGLGVWVRMWVAWSNTVPSDLVVFGVRKAVVG